MILFFFRLLSRLPLAWLHGLGSCAGMLTYWLSARYRHELRANLAQAGYHDARLERRAAREAGKSVFELPFVWLRPQQDVLAKTATAHWELIDAARQSGRGIIFLTPHLGCFEITAQHFATRANGAPITVLFRPPRKAILKPLLEGARARPNLRLAAADLSGVKRLLKALRRGEAIGLLPDQVPRRGEGVMAPHFGRPAYTMTLPARLAAQGNPVLLLAFGERLPRAQGWIVHIAPFTGTLAGPAEAQASSVTAALETLIRRCPEQYLWGYRRYKLPPGVRAS